MGGGVGMEFNKNRIYTAVNADELKIGSRYIFADAVGNLQDKVENNNEVSMELALIKPTDRPSRFEAENGNWYLLAYLIEPPAEPKYKPFKDIDTAREAINKHGGWVSHRDCKNYFFITGYLPHLNEGIGICIGLVWHTLQELYDDFIFADDGSPCGELEL